MIIHICSNNNVTIVDYVCTRLNRRLEHPSAGGQSRFVDWLWTVLNTPKIIYRNGETTTRLILCRTTWRICGTLFSVRVVAALAAS